MPGLPEVETIKRVLEPQVKSLKISDITVNRADIIAYPSAEIFCEKIKNQTISAMGRQEKHTHIIFHLSNGSELRFSDIRRFGRFWYIQKNESDTYSGISRLGLEPFDKNLSAEYLETKFGRRKKTVKECLLDQSVVAGIGNIYSDEILFRAKVCPARPANSLTGCEWERLSAVIPECLAFFIEKNAITPEEYLRTKGQDYRNTPFLQVYGHGGDACLVCGKILCRTVIGGRSSVYCPECQQNLP